MVQGNAVVLAGNEGSLSDGGLPVSLRNHRVYEQEHKLIYIYMNVHPSFRISGMYALISVL